MTSEKSLKLDDEMDILSVKIKIDSLLSISTTSVRVLSVAHIIHLVLLLHKHILIKIDAHLFYQTTYLVIPHIALPVL